MSVLSEKLSYFVEQRQETIAELSKSVESSGQRYTNIYGGNARCKTSHIWIRLCHSFI